MAEPMILAEGLRKAFGDARALGGVDPDVPPETALGRAAPAPPRAGAGRRGAEVPGRFELAHAADRTAKTYSGGMRRRLDLGASLVGRPKVLFLAEPTPGLDPLSRPWD